MIQSGCVPHPFWLKTVRAACAEKCARVPCTNHQRFDWLSAKYANGTLNIPIVPPRVAELATTTSQEATQKGQVDPEIPPTEGGRIEPPPEPEDRTLERNKNRRRCQCLCGGRRRRHNRHICDGCGNAVCTSHCLLHKDPIHTWCKWCRVPVGDAGHTVQLPHQA